jgi:branched-chain amino acid transport system substrate-binding protein
MTVADVRQYMSAGSIPSQREVRMKNWLAAAALLGIAAMGQTAVGEETRGVTPTEIVLGMHTDLSGPAATYGVSSSNAVKMRFDEVNANGGIHRRKIRLIVEDTQYQVPRAVQAGTKLINRDRILAMVAPLGTPMNNALFKDQLEAGVPNLFPLSAARSMYLPFNRLKFYGAASYVDQVRAGINYFVVQKGKKAVCAMYQDTDFGKEVLDGVQMQVDELKLKMVETTTHKPTDQDFTAQITRLKGAGCDLVVLGTIVRDSIVPYATARKIGWTDVDFLGAASSYDMFVAAAQGGVTEGLYAMGLTDMPYRDSLSPAAQGWFDRYKERFKVDPNIGAVYGHDAADLTVLGLDRAGPNLTLDTFISGLESIKNYRDIFNGPAESFGPDKHQGASSSFLAVVKGGRWVRLTDPLSY